jgi:hypothetical protein
MDLSRSSGNPPSAQRRWVPRRAEQAPLPPLPRLTGSRVSLPSTALDGTGALGFLPDASNPAGDASGARQAEARPRARARNYAFDLRRTSNQRVHSMRATSRRKPVRSSPRPRPRGGTGRRFGFPPELRHRHRQRTSGVGTGHRARTWNNAYDISRTSDLACSLNACDLASHGESQVTQPRSGYVSCFAAARYGRRS